MTPSTHPSPASSDHDSSPLVQDPRDAALAAGLRYVSDDRPGLRRRRRGRRFRYLTAAGDTVTDQRTLDRIASLAIPPAWTEVWICPSPNGHLQATGRDARGRKQYRYHPRWRVVRDETKYGRLLAFGSALPGLRSRIAEDLKQSGLPRTKVLAAVVRLLDTTLIRVGNEEYARHNDSYGLTTLRDEHVDIAGTTIHFCFRGKSGKEHAIDLRDRRLAATVKRCRDLPGQDLFQYLDDAGEPHTVGSTDVNAYLRAAMGDDYTAKDFRTWAGSALAARELRALGPAASETEARKTIVAAVAAVSDRLGNTAAVCRKCYIHPAVIAAYEDGSLFTLDANAAAAPCDQLGEDEALLCVLLAGGSEW